MGVAFMASVVRRTLANVSDKISGLFNELGLSAHKQRTIVTLMCEIHNSLDQVPTARRCGFVSDMGRSFTAAIDLGDVSLAAEIDVGDRKASILPPGRPAAPQ